MTRRLTALLATVITVQSGLGLLFPDRYHDTEWIAATWWGNDWITLVVAAPLLVASSTLGARGSTRALMLSLGMFAYCIYNYAYYLFGAALNVFFPLYLCAVLSASFALMASLTSLEATDVAARFRLQTPVRAIGGYFVFVGGSLTAVWLTIWAAYVFGGRPTPIEPDAFKLVAALDIVLMAPALTIGGACLWRRNPWGYLVSCIAGVQASLYLLVLAVNSLVFLSRGLAKPPGELPLWGSLALTTIVMTLLLLAHASSPDGGPAPLPRKIS